MGAITTVSYVLEKLFSDLWTGMAYFSNAGTCPLSDGSQGRVGVSIILHAAVLCEFSNSLYEKRTPSMEPF